MDAPARHVHITTAVKAGLSWHSEDSLTTLAAMVKCITQAWWLSKVRQAGWVVGLWTHTVPNDMQKRVCSGVSHGWYGMLILLDSSVKMHSVH